MKKDKNSRKNRRKRWSKPDPAANVFSFAVPPAGVPQACCKTKVRVYFVFFSHPGAVRTFFPWGTKPQKKDGHLQTGGLIGQTPPFCQGYSGATEQIFSVCQQLFYRKKGGDQDGKTIFCFCSGKLSDCGSAGGRVCPGR
ncbi:hypothetical protein [Desulfosudis oleivorans]|uniref:hypothetical protein n=1 Tax=Desulfosudis oleivorans TaxID=181663 RepID=UPI001427EAE4|nr:hypothetical protein [Desulfosudis oleivorans]